MKKALSVLLVVLMLVSCASIAIAAEAPNGLLLPTIYIKGKMEAIYNDIGTADEWMVSDSSRVFSKEVTDVKEYAKEKAKELLPLFVIGLMTDNYGQWADGMSTLLEPIYRDFVLDKNGQPREGSGVKFDYTNLRNQVRGDGTYGTESYYFMHDWRLSPIDAAKQLNDYIDAVLRVTGKNKVNLVSRCEGCCIALSYFCKYGDSKIANNVMLGSSALGVVYASNIFACKFDINSDAVNRYFGRNFATDSDKSFGGDLFDDEVVTTFVKETVSLLAVTHAIDLPGDKIESLIEKLAPMVVPDLLMSSYGTCPSYWAMVRDDDYEDAKKMAGLTDNPEYAAFVELIDDYHYNVQQKADEILKGLENDGIPTGLLVKYGSETLPFIQDCNELSDNTTLVKDASFGATTSKVQETLPAAYIAAAEADGKGAYISADKQIDASTGLFPETTWYMKYFGHTKWGGPVDTFIVEFLRSGGTMRPGENGAMPRFMVANMEDYSVQEMTDENANNQSNYYQTNKLSSLFSFLTAFIPFLQKVIEWVKAKLNK